MTQKIFLNKNNLHLVQLLSAKHVFWSIYNKLHKRELENITIELFKMTYCAF